MTTFPLYGINPVRSMVTLFRGYSRFANNLNQRISRNFWTNRKLDLKLVVTTSSLISNAQFHRFPLPDFLVKKEVAAYPITRDEAKKKELLNNGKFKVRLTGGHDFEAGNDQGGNGHGGDGGGGYNSGGGGGGGGYGGLEGSSGGLPIDLEWWGWWLLRRACRAASDCGYRCPMWEVATAALAVAGEITDPNALCESILLLMMAPFALLFCLGMIVGLVDMMMIIGFSLAIVTTVLLAAIIWCWWFWHSNRYNHGQHENDDDNVDT